MLLKLSSSTTLSEIRCTGGWENRIQGITNVPIVGGRNLDCGIHVALLNGETGEFRPTTKRVFFATYNDLEEDIAKCWAYGQEKSRFDCSKRESSAFLNYLQQNMVENDILVMVIMGCAPCFEKGEMTKKLNSLGASQFNLDKITDTVCTEDGSRNVLPQQHNGGWIPWVFASQNGRALIDKVGQPNSTVSDCKEVLLGAEKKAKQEAEARAALDLARQRELERAREENKRAEEAARKAEIARLEAERQRQEQQKAQEHALVLMKKQQEEAAQKALVSQKNEIEKKLSMQEEKLKSAVQPLSDCLKVLSVFNVGSESDRKKLEAQLTEFQHCTSQ